MSILTLLSLLFAAGTPALSASAEPAPVVSSPEASAAVVWRASGVVASSGALREVPGWRVRLGLGGRAHLIGPAPRASQPVGPWDDEVTARGVRVSVRVTARDADAVYVAGHLRSDGRFRSFLLRWDAASGAWSEIAGA